MKFVDCRLIITAAIAIWPFLCHGNDLDDGIPLDTPIDDSLQTSPNISFIKMKAQGLRMIKSKKVISNKDQCGQGNQVFGMGANLKGAIIINESDNRGATAVCEK